jgi:transcriptional regulator with PAS, ATPase and Fis domain
MPIPATHKHVHKLLIHVGFFKMTGKRHNRQTPWLGHWQQNLAVNAAALAEMAVKGTMPGNPKAPMTSPTPAPRSRLHANAVTDPPSELQVHSLISFLEHDAQPMIVLDTDYNILAANTAYRRQYGAVDKPYIGHKCYRISHHYDLPCDQAGEHCPMQRALRFKGPDRVLHIHHTPSGPEHVDVELRPILNARREVVAFVERLATVRSASARPSAEGLVGSAPAFNAALAAVQRVAPSMLPVLLLGESGTGKELFARAVHEASDRASGPFVVVDCSGFTETLFESELFGYEKGAFTGAHTRKTGLVETADGGSLFLDEMGDVPLPMQVKLLRLIESGTFRRVGSVETRKANFRLIAATHKPLVHMLADGRFRQDLYYRISAFPIHLPALRERASDIPLLVDSFLQRGGKANPPPLVSSKAMARLQAHDWPGNIRELRNVIDRARLFADDGIIQVENLGLDTSPALAGPGSTSAAPASAGARYDDTELARLTASFSGTRRELAQRVGLSERTLYRRLKALGLA